jgi:hypothetical protein
MIITLATSQNWKKKKKEALISIEFTASIHKNIDIDNSKGGLAFCCMS